MIFTLLNCGTVLLNVQSTSTLGSVGGKFEYQEVFCILTMGAAPKARALVQTSRYIA
jgi:hypothetical protein